MILIRRVLLLTAFLFASVVVEAQVAKINDDFDKFYFSFSSAVSYPSALIKSCSPTMCILKIDLSASGAISDMRLSDSADSLLKIRFDAQKYKLDTVAFKKYIKANYAKNKSGIYIIPLFYTLFRMPCPEANIDFVTLNNYYKFNGKLLIGNLVLLRDFSYKIYVQR